MMMSGATATIGVTCSSTAYGKSAVSIDRLCTKAKEISTPTTVATAKASSVILSVTNSAPPSGDAIGEERLHHQDRRRHEVGRQVERR